MPHIDLAPSYFISHVACYQQLFYQSSTDSGGDGEILNYNISHVRNTSIPLFWRILYTQNSFTPLPRRVVGVNYPTELQENEGARESLKEVTWTCAIDLKGTKMYPQS